MKKAVLFATIALVMGAWTFGCTTVVVKGESGPEVLLPGEFIEAVDATTELVKCTGIGVDQQDAINQARKGCLEWYIKNRLAQTPGERQAFLAQQQNVFAKLDRYVNIPPPGSRDGKGKGIKSRVRMQDERVKVIIITDVHKRDLEQDLVGLGIIASKEQMLDAVGRPEVVALPSKANKAKSFRKVMDDLTNSYLTKNKWEVVDMGAIQNLNKMVEAIGEASGAEEDENMAIATAAGADVYFVYEAKKEKSSTSDHEVAWSVGISAFETTTGRKLASDTALSAARHTGEAGNERAAQMEAMNDAMAKVIPQVTDYWREDAPKGRKYRIFLKNMPKKADLKLAGVFKRNCSQVKRTEGTSSSARFLLQCKMDNMELETAMDEGIEKKLGGAEYEAVKSRNAMILIFK